MFKSINGGKMPERATKHSACVDLFSNEDVVIGAGETKIVGLGVCIDMDWMIDSADIFYTNEGMLPKYKLDHFMKTHYLQLMLRSSLSKHLIIANGVGVIDLDYKDVIKIRLHRPFDTLYNGLPTCKNIKIKKGDKIAQITLLEHKSYLFGIESDVERSGGFGSSGK